MANFWTAPFRDLQPGQRASRRAPAGAARTQAAAVSLRIAVVLRHHYLGCGRQAVAPHVRDHGVNLVVLGDALAAPEIADLAGLHSLSDYVSPDSLAIAREHFITRGVDVKSFQPPGRY